MTPSRAEAWRLLSEHVRSESLRKHMLAVETALRAYAAKFGGDPDEWGSAGLLHDFDYEEHPNPNRDRSGHPFPGVEILKKEGYPESVIEAILGHATYSGIPRITPMAKALFACDELCGFLMAIAYMRPDHLLSITPDTVRKYLKKKKFAEKVSREEIIQSIAELGVPEDEHFETVIGALRNISSELGF